MNAVVSDTKFPTFSRIGKALKNLPRAGFPTFRRVVRGIRRVFFSRRSLMIYLVLITLTVLFYTTYRWQGRRAWAAERERLIAAGEPVTLEQLREPLPPEEENFFATPVLKELFTTGANAEHCKMWLGKRTVPALLRGKPYDKTIPYPQMDAPLKDWVRVLREYKILPAPPADDLSPAEQLLADHRFDALIEELCTAARRPQAMFLLPPNPDNSFTGYGDIQISSPLLRSLLLHARAQLETGNSRRASEIFVIFARFTGGFLSQGTFTDLFRESISGQRRNELLHSGIKRRFWTEEDLQVMQRMDLRLQMLKAFKPVIRYERIFVANYIQNYKAMLPHIYVNEEKHRRRIGELYLRMIPEGWWMRQCVEVSRYMQTMEETLNPLEVHETWLSRMQRLKGLEAPDWQETLHPFASQSGVSGGYYQIPEIFLKTLIKEEQRQLALALERHWLREKRYPAVLADLQPAPEGGIPRDFDGQPMRYRINPDASAFTVWSVGMNGIDETAIPAKESDDLRFSTE